MWQSKLSKSDPDLNTNFQNWRGGQGGTSLDASLTEWPCYGHKMRTKTQIQYNDKFILSCHQEEMQLKLKTKII